MAAGLHRIDPVKQAACHHGGETGSGIGKSDLSLRSQPHRQVPLTVLEDIAEDIGKHPAERSLVQLTAHWYSGQVQVRNNVPLG